MMLRRAFVAGLALVGAAGSSISASAQEVTLRLHQMLPPQAMIPAHALVPWAEKVEAESGGRIKVEHYPSMQLGGKPPALFDQAKDGVVDLTWTLFGYTPGRFNGSEVFELPFMMTDAVATSKALQEFYETHMQGELAGVKVIALHVHGPGVIHMRGAPIEKLEDLAGKKMRGPTRIITRMLEILGATPIGMPVPAVPEALSKGVIDGTVIPWEVTVPLKIAELVDNHTQLSGPSGLYTATFAFVMNQGAYDRLPDDLKKVIDDNSGVETAGLFGQAMADGDVIGLRKAQEHGNPITTLDEAETARWQAAAQPVVDEWVKEMAAKGIDGQALIADAKALIEKYTAQ